MAILPTLDLATAVPLLAALRPSVLWDPADRLALLGRVDRLRPHGDEGTFRPAFL